MVSWTKRVTPECQVLTYYSYITNLHSVSQAPSPPPPLHPLIVVLEVVIEAARGVAVLVHFNCRWLHPLAIPLTSWDLFLLCIEAVDATEAQPFKLSVDAVCHGCCIRVMELLSAVVTVVLIPVLGAFGVEDVLAVCVAHCCWFVSTSTTYSSFEYY